MNLSTLFDANSIVADLGLAGVLAILFAETGLLVGLFFPGDSLLFVAGIAASGSAEKILGTHISVASLFIGAPIAAILGSQLGFYFGKTVGPKYFERPDGKIFNQERVRTTEKWISKYGVGKALIFARFIPIVRTLINPMAGIIHVPARRFLALNILGAFIWTESVMVLGLMLGNKLSGSVDKYLLPIIALIIFFSFIPVLIEIFKPKR